jgi:signal transduction histidine kinase
VANLIFILVFSRWETIPFHFIWISLTLLYGFRVWATRPTLWVLAVVMATTFAAIGWDVHEGAQSVDELNEVPLMAMMFLADGLARPASAGRGSRAGSGQRRERAAAGHPSAGSCRTPRTSCARPSPSPSATPVLARELTDRTERRDIEVVVGELSRLRRLGERLLVIAASEDPDFLRPEPIALDRFMMDVIGRWRPTADRQWQLGRLDPVTIGADRERLGLAVDALLENAVRHTGCGDTIQLSVLVSGPDLPVRMIVADTGQGIAPSELEHIFDRFRTGSPPGGAAGRHRVQGHRAGPGPGASGGPRARRRRAGAQHPGAGSEFEMVLPAPAVSTGAMYPALPLNWSGGPPEPRRTGP